MKYKCETTLKTGETLVLRSLQAQDAEDVIRVCKKTAGETDFMMRYEDEWTITPEQEREYIRSAENGPKSLMLGAFVRDRLVGIASIMPPSPVDRVRHRVNMGISILKSHWGLGIGTAIMQALIAQARTTAIEQIELEVVSTNETAIRLYKRYGFETFAHHPRKLKYRDGRYADLLLMMLDLRRGS